ncbi:MAG: pyrroline-5-carboxylate reductase [Porticoccaceae bacterium]|nr:pyrroline-5-carboxylate reductase [Porticoccaceae bacterium]
MNLLFIGAGKMASALAAGLQKKNIFPHDNLWACDISAAAREQFTKSSGLPCVEDPSALIGKADVLILAVKPQVAQAVVSALPPRKNDALIISICAGVSILKLRQWFASGRIVRVMPNTPLMVGMGASCYALGTESDEAAAALSDKIFSALGKAWRVSEELLDAVTAISGSGPAYMFEFIEALRVAGEKLGLPQELALDLAVQTMAGSAEMMRQKIASPEELRKAVTSPGGTTAAALQVLEQANFRALVENLTRAACERSAELGK